MGHSGRVSLRSTCVLLDTNMLMLLNKGMDVFSRIEELLETRVDFIVPKPVVEELRRISRGGTPLERRAAWYALRILEEGRARIMDIPRPTGVVDMDIALYARSRGCMVATNDRGLRRALRKLGVPDIHLRESEGVLEASFTPPRI